MLLFILIWNYKSPENSAIKTRILLFQIVFGKQKELEVEIMKQTAILYRCYCQNDISFFYFLL